MQNAAIEQTLRDEFKEHIASVQNVEQDFNNYRDKLCRNAETTNTDE
ncbi:hypothetical protein [Pseudoalteromonas obscura]|uniref:Uncharacterized protein n=1 Tax=Pseudoalteromonas obscura TaxID=3048491 RepID=A0ABT7EP26_9GAMM|nr:hypothetical protein [Pseudoalteromonas sp. P94(2023)]MDK2596804.1 hypothetical protein [Pseudoalteromonas sp. P94(2023)]